MYYIYVMKCYLAIKKRRNTDTGYNMDEPLKDYAKQKKPVTEGHILYDSLCMKCPEQMNPQRREADQWLPRAGGRGEWGVIIDGYGVSLGDAENVLELDRGDGGTTL